MTSPQCTSLSLDSYRLLGRSGLRVSPLSLGTMTFGSEWGWGADEDEARRIFNTYVESGGNSIDTANVYTNGTSEDLVGKFSHSVRDRLVISTKYSLRVDTADPNSGGNHRKSMVRSVELSLRRLKTTYIDLLYLHAWDGTTASEEILRAMDDLVRAGKVLNLGISDTPAWRVAAMQTIAELRGWSSFTSLQVEYSLVDRTAERELLPMAGEMGLGVMSFAPLAGGILSGKYTAADRNDMMPVDGTRKALLRELGSISDAALTIAEAVKDVAAELERPPVQVALAWALRHPGITSPILGARTLAQFSESLGALQVSITSEQFDRLSKLSAIKLGFPYELVAELRQTGFMTAKADFGCVP